MRNLNTVDAFTRSIERNNRAFKYKFQNTGELYVYKGRYDLQRYT